MHAYFHTTVLCPNKQKNTGFFQNIMMHLIKTDHQNTTAFQTAFTRTLPTKSEDTDNQLLPNQGLWIRCLTIYQPTFRLPSRPTQ